MGRQAGVVPQFWDVFGEKRTFRAGVEYESPILIWAGSGCSTLFIGTYVVRSVRFELVWKMKVLHGMPWVVPHY